MKLTDYNFSQNRPTWLLKLFLKLIHPTLTFDFREVAFFCGILSIENNLKNRPWKTSLQNCIFFTNKFSISDNIPVVPTSKRPSIVQNSKFVFHVLNFPFEFNWLTNFHFSPDAISARQPRKSIISIEDDDDFQRAQEQTRRLFNDTSIQSE